nr:hypothetical protein [uncultured Campylobacter sp.]
MKRRDFLKLGALAAVSAQAKQFNALAQAIFNEQMGLSATARACKRVWLNLALRCKTASRS